VGVSFGSLLLSRQSLCQRTSIPRSVIPRSVFLPVSIYPKYSFHSLRLLLSKSQGQDFPGVRLPDVAKTNFAAL